MRFTLHRIAWLGEERQRSKARLGTAWIGPALRGGALRGQEMQCAARQGKIFNRRK